MQEREHLIISTNTEMVRLREDAVVCITSDGNYSHIAVVGGEKFMESKRVLFLNSFLKKGTKQYKGEIEVARRILKKYICGG